MCRYCRANDVTSFEPPESESLTLVKSGFVEPGLGCFL